MKNQFVDIAIIGAGSAGLRAYRSAIGWTDKVVLIEGGSYGTTCARVGCMPSKLLIAAAETAHDAAQAHLLGVHTGQVNIDGAAVMERVRRERDRFVSFVVEDVEKIPESRRIRGHARFLNDHQIQIDDHTLVTAKRIIITTGSTPNYPDFLAKLGDRLVVNDDIFEWQDLPRSVAVVGPGVIGLEIGQALSRLGVKVTMFGQGGQIGPLSDTKVMQSAKEAFSKEFYLDAHSNIEHMKQVNDGVEVKFKTPEGITQLINVDYVVAATGRSPNVKGLGLENTQLPLDARGIPIFDEETLQVGVSHVFIAGDVNNDRPLLHEASDEGEIAGNNAGRYPDIQRSLRRSPLSIVFTDPQITIVGSRYKDLENRNFVVGEVAFENQGRSRVMLKNQGILRVYADPENGRLLGAEMLGPRAEHIGHLLAWSHQAGLTVDQMLQMPFYHPVVEEGLRTALRNASQKLKLQHRNAA